MLHTKPLLLLLTAFFCTYPNLANSQSCDKNIQRCTISNAACHLTCDSGGISYTPITTDDTTVYLHANTSSVIDFRITSIAASLTVSISVYSCTNENTCYFSTKFTQAVIPSFAQATIIMKIVSVYGGGSGSWIGTYNVAKLKYDNPIGSYIPDSKPFCMIERPTHECIAASYCALTCGWGFMNMYGTSFYNDREILINIGNQAIIMFDITYLYLRSNEYVSVYSCTTTSSCTVLLQTFYGNEWRQVTPIGAISKTGIMKIVWRGTKRSGSDTIYGPEGWTARYIVSQKAVPCPIGTFNKIAPQSPCYPDFDFHTNCKPCTINTCHYGNIIKRSTISFAGYSGWKAYSSGENNQLFIAPPGATSVSFTLIWIDTTNQDYIQISSCVSSLLCTVIAERISGVTIPQNPTTISNTGIMLIRWVSNLNGGQGWKGYFTSETNNNECSPCPIGEYAGSTGSSQCSSCSSTQYTTSTGAADVSACTECPTGTYSGGPHNCTACKVGSYNSLTGQSSCTACVGATYTTSTGTTAASSCIQCPLGTYSSGGDCIACKAGSYNPWTGKTGCTECPMGTYSTALMAETLSVCVQCTAATYNPTLGSNSSSACLLCPAGSYSSISAATTCMPCPSGNYGTSTGATAQSETCIVCEMGKYGKAAMATCVSNDVFNSYGGTYESRCRSGTITMNSQTYGQILVYTIFSPGTISISILRVNTVWDSDIFFYDGIDSGQTWSDGYETFPILYGNQLAHYIPGYWFREGASGCCPGPSVSTTGILTLAFVNPYADSGANWQMQFTTDTAPQTSCTFCPVGSYNDVSGTTSCIQCPTGYYGTITGATNSLSCILCQPGTYSNLGMSVCLQCDLGTYNSAYGTPTCASCHLGSYNTGVGLTSCLLCNAGSFSNTQPATTCTLCSAGTYNPMTGSSSSASCVKCISGTFSTMLGSRDSGSCSKCQPGTFNSLPGGGTSTFCVNCAAGTFSTLLGSGTSESCSKCIAGTFSTFLGSTSSATCTPCVSGTFSTATGATTSVTCAKCQAGTFSTTVGSSASLSCTLCKTGTFSTLLGSNTSTTCTPCDVGKYSTLLGSPNTSAICLKCSQGTYNSIYGASTCSNCQSGTYSSVLGQISATQCLYCTPGTYTPLNASSYCLSCLPGTYATGNGSTTCSKCASYTYSTGIGASRIEECSPCKTGSFNKSATNISCAQCLPCKICPPGTTSSGVCQPGTVVNTVCTCDRENTYFNGNQCIQCKICHPNATTIRRCVKGSTTDITLCQCASLSYGDGVTSCTPCPTCHSTQFLPVPCSNNLLNPNSLQKCTCVPGTFSNLASPTACTVCGSGFYQPSTGGTYCMSCPAGKSSIATNGIACA